MEVQVLSCAFQQKDLRQVVVSPFSVCDPNHRSMTMTDAGAGRSTCLHLEFSDPASLKKFARDDAAGQQVHGAAGGIDDGVVQSKAQGVIDDCAEVFDADFA